jgi:hypothetical protein
MLLIYKIVFSFSPHMSVDWINSFKVTLSFEFHPDQLIDFVRWLEKGRIKGIKLKNTLKKSFSYQHQQKPI